MQVSKKNNKSLMRNLGEFVGHVVRGVKVDPSKRKQVVRKEVEEEQRGNVTLRRTTIEEIEINRSADRRHESVNHRRDEDSA